MILGDTDSFSSLDSPIYESGASKERLGTRRSQLVLKFICRVSGTSRSDNSRESMDSLCDGKRINLRDVRRFSWPFEERSTYSVQ